MTTNNGTGKRGSMIYFLKNSTRDQHYERRLTFSLLNSCIHYMSTLRSSSALPADAATPVALCGFDSLPGDLQLLVAHNAPFVSFRTVAKRHAHLLDYMPLSVMSHAQFLRTLEPVTLYCGYHTVAYADCQQGRPIPATFDGSLPIPLLVEASRGYSTLFALEDGVINQLTELAGENASTKPIFSSRRAASRSIVNMIHHVAEMIAATHISILPPSPFHPGLAHDIVDTFRLHDYFIPTVVSSLLLPIADVDIAGNVLKELEIAKPHSFAGFAVYIVLNHYQANVGNLLVILRVGLRSFTFVDED